MRMFVVAVDAPGFQANSVALSVPALPLELTLEPGSTVGGLVTDRDGHPLAAASVWTEGEPPPEVRCMSGLDAGQAPNSGIDILEAAVASAQARARAIDRAHQRAQTYAAGAFSIAGVEP
jgi:hypothetical protein